MKKPLIAAALLVTVTFGAGYAIGQISGVTGGSAASAVVTPTSTTTETTPDAGHPESGAQSHDAPHADGTVTAINGDTLTIAAGTDPSGTSEYTAVTTVLLTSSTKYEAGHDSTATVNKSSIKVGSYIIVDGTLSSDGKTMTASSLGIHDGGPVPGR